ncbi:unnamed protein product [Adineta steineri]|uniref:Uncharacterized protein n=1 Tax=Adineta steineri TaxID=433720 RepID=A0A815WRG6_9BILA|nr:unnamed protein product [Adineta steineri]CAF1547580.1 unnamed protein product [Adineta steineri]
MIRANINSLFDPNIDEEIEYQPDMETEWEDLMAGGPASINFMGAVMAVASRADFRLNANFSYTLVKHPDSFQTTLVQVANDMYRALYGAHTGMQKIQANMRRIPTLLKTVLKVVTQASPFMTKTLLPQTLSHIGQYANESAAVARASLDQFDHLQALLQEVVEASTSTNKDNKDLAEKLAAEAEDMRIKKMNMDLLMASIKNEYEAAQQNLERARQDYQVAMLNVPGGQWDSTAWNVYASHRPSRTCTHKWGIRKCRSLRDEQFQQYTHEAKIKAEAALDILKRAEERSRELFNEQMHKQTEVNVAIHTISMINFNETSINQTIAILLDAAQKIALIQTQWSRITRFFSKLAIDTEYTQRVILQDFLGVINAAESMSAHINLIDQTLFTVLLVESATDIDRDCHLLFLMAKTYSDVSSEYMLDQIAGLAGVITLQNDGERETYVKQVASKSRATSIKIKALAVERQKKYELANFDRQEQYMQFIQEGMIQEELNNLGGIGIGKR